MSTIRCIYNTPPDFPATEQHPDAVRYQIGDVWVDAIGGKPTQLEIDAVLAVTVVAPPMKRLTDRLVAKGVLTQADVDGMTLFQDSIGQTTKKKSGG